MQDLDAELLKEFRERVRNTGSGTFQDPSQPYEVSVQPTKTGHVITIIDTRKRWYGRDLIKHEHSLDKHLEIVDNGPAAVAVNLLQMVIERKVPLG